MKLLPVFIQVAGELGIGTVLFLCIQKTGEIRVSFFNFMAWVTAVCFFLISLAENGAQFYRAVYFPSAVLAAIAARQFTSERMKMGKALSLFSAAIALFYMVIRTWNAPSKTGSQELAIVNLAAGIFYSAGRMAP